MHEPAANVASPTNARNNIAGALSHRYPYDLLRAALAVDQLFVMSHVAFGPVTGWRYKGEPLAYQIVARDGDPCKPKAATAKLGARFGARGDLVTDHSHLKVGDFAYVRYEPDDPETDDPEDQPGYYCVRIARIGRLGLTVTFANVPEAGQFRYHWIDTVVELSPLENA